MNRKTRKKIRKHFFKVKLEKIRFFYPEKAKNKSKKNTIFFNPKKIRKNQAKSEKSENFEKIRKNPDFFQN